MSDLLKSLIAVTNNPFAATAEDGIPGSKTEGWIDTGSYAFNAMLSASCMKGLADNKVLGIAGEEATGKTWFTLSLVKSYLDKHPKAICVYFDTESAITNPMLIQRGIPLDRVAHIAINTIEEFRTQALRMVETYLELPESKRVPMIICLDSLGMLSTNKEVGDTREGKDTKDMTRTQLIKGAFRLLTMKLGIAKIPMIITNHCYMTQEMYPKVIISGGKGLYYAASTIVLLSKRKEKEGKEVIGNVIHCKLFKGRGTKENSMVDVLLRYDTGLNKYYGLLPIAEKYGIFKKIGNKYELPNGKKLFESQINANPEECYTEDVMKLLETAVDTEFSYGKSFDGVVPDEIEEDDEE